MASDREDGHGPADDRRRPASSPSPKSDGGSRSPATKRTNNARACVACHQRKVRCDIVIKGAPCSSCKAHGRPNCCLYEKKRTRASLARQARAPIAIQPRATTAAADSRHPPSAAGRTASWKDVVTRQASQESSSAAAQAGTDSHHIRRSRADTSPPASIHNGDCGNLAEFIDREELRVREVASHARVYFIGTEVSNLNYLVRQRSGDLDPGRLHFGTRQFARSLNRLPPEALEPPDKALAEELLHAYFTNVNPGWPIVDEVEFRRLYSGEDPRKPVPLALLNAIFLVGSHVLGFEREEFRAMKATFFQRTNLIVDSRIELDRVIYCQVGLLLTWYCNDLEDTVSNSWYWVGFAARTAMGLGMHRNVRNSNLRHTSKQEWIRFWWVLVQFDVLVSAAYGRPQAINLDESDVPELLPEDFEGVPNANVDFVIQNSRLCVIFSRAMKRRLALNATEADRVEATRDADRALAEFANQLPEHLHLSLPNIDLWQSVLHMTYNHFLILLHRPPANQLAASPARAHSDAVADLSICEDAAAVVGSIFDSIRASGALRSIWLPGMYALFTAMVYVNSALKTPNPVVATKSQRMLRSYLLSVRELAPHWIYAQSLRRLFEERPRRDGHHPWQQLAKGAVVAPPAPPARPDHGPAGDDSRFSLRPNPLSHNHPGASFGPADDAQALGGQSGPPISAMPLGISRDGHFEAGYANSGLGVGADSAQDMSVGQAHDPSLVTGGSEMTFSGDLDSFDVLQFPSALDFFLAGMDDEYPYQFLEGGAHGV